MLKPKIGELVEAAKASDRFRMEPQHEYVEIDQIRLVFEDGDLCGWYRPGEESDDDNLCD